MNKVHDVIMNCFISAAILFSFQYVVISLIVCCTEELMKAKTRIQLINNYYVTVVFLTQ